MILHSHPGEARMTAPRRSVQGGLIGTYVLVDAADKPLYVGASNDIARRLNQHRHRKPHWWRLVADVWIIPAATRAAAHEEEQRKILELRPPHNRMLRSGAGRPVGKRPTS